MSGCLLDDGRGPCKAHEWLLADAELLKAENARLRTELRNLQHDMDRDMLNHSNDLTT